MKHKAHIALLLALAAGVALIAWQQARISDLEERLDKATAELGTRQPFSGASRVRAAPETGISPAANTPNPSPTVTTKRPDSAPSAKAPRDEKRAAFEKQLAEARNARRAASPPSLTPERRKALMQGQELFNPGPIEESTIPVTAQTALQTGQTLQVKYSNTWYAAEVVGFENDGGIHIRYFGWGPSWDEVVPREDLRIDPHARERAVEKFAAARGNG